MLWSMNVPRLLALCLAVAVVGCTTTEKKRTGLQTSDAPVAPISNTDECATRLQDMCGGLLMYYQINKRLPASLHEIDDFPGGQDSGPMVCPVSKQPYVYVPAGIFLPEKNTRIIVYDPAPSHSHLRWAISIDEPDPEKPLVTKVIALPDSFFLLRR